MCEVRTAEQMICDSSKSALWRRQRGGLTSSLWIRERASLSRFSASCSRILGSLCIDWSRLICTSTEPLLCKKKPHMNMFMNSFLPATVRLMEKAKSIVTL